MEDFSNKLLEDMEENENLHIEELKNALSEAFIILHDKYNLYYGWLYSDQIDNKQYAELVTGINMFYAFSLNFDNALNRSIKNIPSLEEIEELDNHA